MNSRAIEHAADEGDKRHLRPAVWLALVASITSMIGVPYLAWQYLSLRNVMDGQALRLQQLESAEQRRPVATLETQARCAQQAQSTFNALGWNKELGSLAENHFNVSLGRCLLKIERTSTIGSTQWTNKSVMDAFEQKVFATYAWKSDAVKKYWEVPPVMCEVTSTAGKRQPCGSEDEFEALIKQYMD